MMEPVFDLDGELFYVDVISLEREFTFPAADTGGTTMDGMVHYDAATAYCHYTMTVRARPGKEDDLNMLWDHLVASPVHACYFPYGSSRISQEMYVTGGKQSLVCARQGLYSWGELTLHFMAAEPRRSE